MAITLHKIEIRYKSRLIKTLLVSDFSSTNTGYKWENPTYNYDWFIYADKKIGEYGDFNNLPEDIKKDITENLFCNIIVIGAKEIESVFQDQTKIFFNFKKEHFKDLAYYYKKLESW